jgi:endonuclease YncB( thermonuclease family)
VRRPARPFCKTIFDTLVFLLVLTLVLGAMQKFGMIDLGSGAYQVVDGDSLRKGGTDIRLYGIDAPEYQQTCQDRDNRDYDCGKQAATELRKLVQGPDLRCSSLETDRYGRAVSICKTESLEINAEMVRQGWAVAYSRHSLNSLNYVKLEAEARRAKRGLWEGRFEEPEAYRNRQRVIRGDLGTAIEVD